MSSMSQNGNQTCYGPGKCYLPNPTREWSRVQNNCPISIENISGKYTAPYSKKIIEGAELQYTLQMLSKGNVLQYKKNSSNLTKKQQYSQIVKGYWTNRTITWANQSGTNANPNNKNLKRVGGYNMFLTGQRTTLPVTCPKATFIPKPALPPAGIPNFIYGSGAGGSASGILEIPPEVPPQDPVAEAVMMPFVPYPTEPDPVVIQNEGVLIVNQTENPCSGEITTTVANRGCHPTTDSDVPGTIRELCWNDGIQPWYPRQRYVMTNSGNKWPANTTILKSAIIDCSNNSA
jgi:hypothetical protein